MTTTPFDLTDDVWTLIVDGPTVCSSTIEARSGTIIYNIAAVVPAINDHGNKLYPAATADFILSSDQNLFAKSLRNKARLILMTP